MNWRVNNMKVIYKENIVSRILDAKKKSDLSNKAINKIILARSEAVELFDISTGNFIVAPLQAEQTIDDVKIAAVNGSRLYGILLEVQVKTLATIELVDGAAYTFDYHKNRAPSIGVYSKSNNTFLTVGHDYFVFDCINIRPMTVESK